MQDYTDLPAFPNPDAASTKAERYAFAVQRECRGLLVSATGAVIARRFPKFFNINERNESRLSAIGDPDRGVCKEKLDGNLCSPVLLLTGEIMATRRCRAVAIEAFAKSSPVHNRLAAWVLSAGATPIFEWCPAAHVR